MARSYTKKCGRRGIAATRMNSKCITCIYMYECTGEFLELLAYHVAWPLPEGFLRRCTASQCPHSMVPYVLILATMKIIDALDISLVGWFYFLGFRKWGMGQGFRFACSSNRLLHSNHLASAVKRRLCCNVLRDEADDYIWCNEIITSCSRRRLCVNSRRYGKRVLVS